MCIFTFKSTNTKAIVKYAQLHQHYFVQHTLGSSEENIHS